MVPDRGSLEREVKLEVDVDFLLPKLPKVVGASEWQSERQCARRISTRLTSDYGVVLSPCATAWERDQGPERGH